MEASLLKFWKSSTVASSDQFLPVEDRAKASSNQTKIRLHQKEKNHQFTQKMMKSFTIRSQFHFQKQPYSNSTSTPPKFVRLTPNLPPCLPPQQKPRINPTPEFKICKDSAKNSEPINPNGHFNLNSKALITGAVSVGVVLLVLGGMEEHGGRALALGPEGPIMEEFWENVRRYALYALTVSTGVLYAVFQPIVELLKNPISAILVIAIAVGGFYIVFQVVNAMVGVSEFSYQYYY